MPQHQKPIPDSPKAKGKFGKVMREFKKGTLKSSSGKKVTDPQQAKAIAASEARRAASGKKKQKKSTKSRNSARLCTYSANGKNKCYLVETDSILYG